MLFIWPSSPNAVSPVLTWMASFQTTYRFNNTHPLWSFSQLKINMRKGFMSWFCVSLSLLLLPPSSSQFDLLSTSCIDIFMGLEGSLKISWFFFYSPSNRSTPTTMLGKLRHKWTETRIPTQKEQSINDKETGMEEIKRNKKNNLEIRKLWF